jgi:hypothetical protein
MLIVLDSVVNPSLLQGSTIHIVLHHRGLRARFVVVRAGSVIHQWTKPDHVFKLLKTCCSTVTSVEADELDAKRANAHVIHVAQLWWCGWDLEGCFEVAD